MCMHIKYTDRDADTHMRTHIEGTSRYAGQVIAYN